MYAVASQIPNVLTLLRIAAAPVLIILLRDHSYELALVVFIVAGITDGLDGYIAKRFNFVTELGAHLDPLADKIIIISAYSMLVWLGQIPFWLVTLVIFRDVVILGGYLVLMALDGDIPMLPTKISKTNTALQISLVIFVLLENTAWNFLPGFSTLLLYAVVATTIASGSQYVWVWAIRRSIKQSPVHAATSEKKEKREQASRTAGRVS